MGKSRCTQIHDRQEKRGLGGKEPPPPKTVLRAQGSLTETGAHSTRVDHTYGTRNDQQNEQSIGLEAVAPLRLDRAYLQLRIGETKAGVLAPVGQLSLHLGRMTISETCDGSYPAYEIREMRRLRVEQCPDANAGGQHAEVRRQNANHGTFGVVDKNVLAQNPRVALKLV